MIGPDVASRKRGCQRGEDAPVLRVMARPCGKLGILGNAPLMSFGFRGAGGLSFDGFENCR